VKQTTADWLCTGQTGHTYTVRVLYCTVLYCYYCLYCTYQLLRFPDSCRVWGEVWRGADDAASRCGRGAWSTDRRLVMCRAGLITSIATGSGAAAFCRAAKCCV